MILPDPKSNRKSIRLKDYDYAQNGAYFITICSNFHKHVFGTITDGKMMLSSQGQIVNQLWWEIPDHFSEIQLDQFVVMPNHIHGIIAISRAQHAAPLPESVPHSKSVQSGSIAAIVRSYKSAVTKTIRANQQGNKTRIWQRNYWERVIRNERELSAYREYIKYNPLKWDHDEFNC
jgi:REP-associated tyrosine transposase